MSNTTWTAWVGGLPNCQKSGKAVLYDQLEKIFGSDYGPVTVVIPETESDDTKGYAFVTFQNEDYLKAAIEQLHDSEHILLGQKKQILVKLKKDSTVEREKDKAKVAARNVAAGVAALAIQLAAPPQATAVVQPQVTPKKVKARLEVLGPRYADENTGNFYIAVNSREVGSDELVPNESFTFFLGIYDAKVYRLDDPLLIELKQSQPQSTGEKGHITLVVTLSDATKQATLTTNHQGEVLNTLLFR